MPENGGYMVAAYVAAAVIYLSYAVYLVRQGAKQGRGGSERLGP